MEPAGGPANVKRVASGGSEFCLTSVSHFLRAQQGEALPARFVAVVVQRSPMAALVAASSSLRQPEDLGSGRLGAPSDSGLTAQFQAALRHRGLATPALVPTPYAEAPAALGRGDIDIVADFIDLLPRTRRQSGIDVRAIAVGPEIYASGLVAADSVPADVVAQMTAALRATLEAQRAQPSRGLAELCERYPDVDPDDARQGWSLVEPNIFTGAAVGSMDAARWRLTLDHLSAAHAMIPPPAGAVYRDDFLAPASAGTGPESAATATSITQH